MATLDSTRIPPVDPHRKVGAVRRRMMRFGLSRFGTWFTANVATRVDPLLLRATRGRVDLSFGLIPIVVVTMRGAKTGRERTLPLIHYTDGDDVILIASGFGRPRHPAWYFNLKAHPEVTLEARGRRGRYRAREVEGAERDRLYELGKNLFAGYQVYEDRTRGIRTVPVFRLSPVDAAAA